MRRTLLYCGLFLAAFAAVRFVVFQVTLLASLSTHSKEESFKAGGLRSFEIVPLETVSETSANASIGVAKAEVPEVPAGGEVQAKEVVRGRKG